MSLRIVSDWVGLNAALRELFSSIENLTTKNLDFHQRRITNAHPSVDDYDYVVRKELVDDDTNIFGQSISKKVKTYDKITFGIGVGTSAVVGNDVTPPYIWTNELNGLPKIAFIAANTSPTGSDFILNILKNGVSVFGATKLVLPNGTGNKVVKSYTGIFSVPTTKFSRGDVVSANVTQIGSSTPGQDITAVLYCSLI